MYENKLEMPIYHTIQPFLTVLLSLHTEGGY
jgi:hypothetical protein